MTDLGHRIGTTLRAVASSVDGFAVPAIDRVVARAARRRRRRRQQLGVATAAAMAVFVAGGLAMAAHRHDRVPPIGGQDTTTTLPVTDTTTSATSRVAPTEAAATSGPLPGGSDAGAAWTPDADHRVATLPADLGWRANAYRAQGPGEGMGEVYVGPAEASGLVRFVTVAASAASSGSTGCRDQRSAAGAPGSRLQEAVRCLRQRTVSVSAVGFDAAAVDRMVAALSDEAPTRLDLTGTDLASVGQGPDEPWSVMIGYTHPSLPGLQLNTIGEARYDAVAIARASGTASDQVDVSIDGAPGLRFTAGPDRPDGPSRTGLVWRPAPGLVASIFVEGPSDELVTIARQVVVRPGDQVHRELNGRFDPAAQPPQTTTTSSTVAGGAPLAGLRSIGVLPAPDGWSPIEYEVRPPQPAFRSEVYVGTTRSDGDRPAVQVQAAPRDPQLVCPPGDTASIGELRLGSDGQLVGSRCLGDVTVVASGRLVDRTVLQRLLASVTAEAPTRFDTSGTDLVSLGAHDVGAGAVRVRYANNDGGPGAMVFTSVDQGWDTVEAMRLLLSPKDWDRAQVSGAPALLYRSVVEGNVAWTNIVWRPAPGVLVTIMVSGTSDRLVAMAESLTLRPAAAAHRELRSLPTFVRPS